MGNTYTLVGILLVIFTFVIALTLWVIVGFIAAWVAPDDREATFFWLTVLLFGPLGILAAAVASPRDPNYFVGEPEPRSIARGVSGAGALAVARSQTFTNPRTFRAGAAGKRNTWSLK